MDYLFGRELCYVSRRKSLKLDIFLSFFLSEYIRIFYDMVTIIMHTVCCPAYYTYKDADGFHAVIIQIRDLVHTIWTCQSDESINLCPLVRLIVNRNAAFLRSNGSSFLCQRRILRKMMHCILQVSDSLDLF